MKKLLLVLFLALTSVNSAQELVTLTAPIVPASATNVRIERITIDIASKSIQIQWQVRDSTGGVVFQENAVYSTPAPVAHPTQPTGAQLLTTLNTANLTANSLIRRVLTRLQADGYIAAGAISGTAE